MDPRSSAQDVVRCDVCDTPVPPLHCDFCQTNLCTACVGEHMLDLSKKHQVVPFQDRGSTPNYPICSKHSPKQCELHCEQCDIPICANCVSSESHKNHKLVDIAEFRRLPPKLTVSPPNFTPQKINPEQLYQQFGSLSAFSITTEEHGYTMETSEAGSSPLQPLLDEPWIISTIQTRYRDFSKNVTTDI